MDSTTLVTFRYQSPRDVARVDLLGSWDNFTKPYPMQRDKSVSSRNWRGCHSFSDIVCDGDIVAMDGSTRSGGLQMGGTYWYYYQLDDDTECHDPTVNSTRGCPFLPGQEVNFLEVPVQRDILCYDSVTSLSNVFTLDPTAKFMSPKRSTSPITLPRLPVECAVRRASSLRESFFSTIPKFSLARSRSVANRNCVTAPSIRNVNAVDTRSRPFTENNADGVRSDWAVIADSTIDSSYPSSILPREAYCELSNLSDTMINLGLGLDQLDLDDNRSTYSNSSEDKFANEITPCPDFMTFISQSPTSNRTSGVFSLLSDSAIGSPASTNRHSYLNAQPQTPSLPKFDSFVLEPIQLDFPNLSSIVDMTIDISPSNQETSLYLQPERDNSSTNTLRLSNTPLKELNHTAKLSPLEKLDLVESWRNGESPSTVPEADPSTLQELINDLGYLSSMID